MSRAAAAKSAWMKVLPGLVLLLWLLSATAALSGAVLPTRIAGGLALLISIGAVLNHSGFSRWIAVLLGGGGALVAFYRDDWPALLDGLGRAATFAAFLGCLYALRSFVQTAPQLREVQDAFVAFRPASRRGAVQFLGFLFSVPLAVGTVSVVAPLIARQKDQAVREETASWALRGMGLAVLFSPFTVAMGVVTSSLGERLPFGVLLGSGFALAVLLMGFPHILGVCRIPRRLPRRFWEALARVLFPVLILIAANLSLVFLFGFTPPQATILLVPPLGATLALYRGKAVRRQMTSITLDAWRRFDSEVAIFVGALVFASVITRVPEISEIVGQTVEMFGPGALIAIAMVGIAVPTALGLHMVVTVTILLTVFAPAMPDVLHLVLLGLSGLIGWAFGAMAALGSIGFLAATRIFDVSASRLALGSNFRFMVVVMLLLVVVSIGIGIG